MATDSSGTGVTSGPPADRRPLPWTRAWFALFLLWMGGLAGLALLLMSRWEQADDVWAMRGWMLALMCFYLSLCNSLVPLPTAWIVLLAASPGAGVSPSPWLNILVVSSLGTLATTLANLNEYHLLAYGLHHGLGQRIRATALYGWAARWFDRAPLALLTLAAFFPIPVDALRWLAILRGYPRPRFALAYVLGRGPRYLIFAACSVLFQLTSLQILVIQVVLVALAVAGRLVWRLRLRRNSRPSAQCS